MKANLTKDTEIKKIKPDQEITFEPGELGATIELIVKKPSGEVTEYRKLKSESFVKQFLQLWWAQSSYLDSNGAALAQILTNDIGGTNRLPVASSAMFASNAGAGDTGKGIVVGRGSTPVGVSDNKLVDKVAHGTSPTQIQYSAVTFGDPAAGASVSVFRITRDFSNASGGTISIWEIGLDVGDGSYSYLAIRDVLGAAINVPSGQVLTINYQIQGSI
jgi:hypothetical protein